MPRLNRQDQEAVVEDGVLNEIGKRFRQHGFARSELDCYFPIGGGTDHALIGRRDDQVRGSGTEFQIVGVGPDERLCVEEDSHSRYSLKSSKCDWSSWS